MADRSWKFRQFVLLVISPHHLMERHKFLHKPLADIRKFLLIVFAIEDDLNKFLAVGGGLDGQFSSTPDHEVMSIPECRIVGLAEDVGHVGGKIPHSFKSDPDESE